MSNHPDRQHPEQGRECPVTGATCYGPDCQGEKCAFENYPFERGKEGRKKVELGDMVMKAIADQAAAIERLTRHEPEDHHHRKHHNPAKALTSSYAVVTPTGDISVIKSNLNNMPQTIVVPFGQSNVPGQLVPVAADNVTVEPISTINAGSEGYTTSDPTIATAAAVPGGPEGAFVVSRVPNAVGTVTVLYTAVNTAGTSITNVGGVGDTFTFQGQPTGVASALTATFGAPTA